MGITSSTGDDAIYRFFIEAERIYNEEIIRAFSYLGEQCIKRIRDRSAEESWIDQTGNLRSSIGYAVYEYGKETIRSAFKKVLNGSDGTQQGEKYLDSLSSSYSDTYALVVVAGMSYAEFVEARDDKDVLASTKLWADGKINEYLQKALQRAEERINRLKF